MNMKETVKTVAVTLGFLLLLAIFPLPYGYYTFLRLIVFIGGLYIAYHLYDKKSHVFSIVFVLLAILFNPIIPVHLSRETWLPIDIMSAITFFFISNKLEKQI
jgi:hypothetical protein